MVLKLRAAQFLSCVHQRWAQACCASVCAVVPQLVADAALALLCAASSRVEGAAAQLGTAPGVVLHAFCLAMCLATSGGPNARTLPTRHSRSLRLLCRWWQLYLRRQSRPRATRRRGGPSYLGAGSARSLGRARPTHVAARWPRRATAADSDGDAGRGARACAGRCDAFGPAHTNRNGRWRLGQN